MLADCMTKSTNGDVLMDAESKNNALQLKEFDSEKVTKEMIETASREIPLEAIEVEQRRETPYLPDQQSLVSTEDGDIMPRRERLDDV